MTATATSNRSSSNVPGVALDPRLARALGNAGRKTEEWKTRRDALIREAHEAGASLREIAAAVGLSNPGVLRVIRRDDEHRDATEKRIGKLKRQIEAERRARHERDY